MFTKNNRIVICGLGLAIVFILTAYIAVPIGQFGYVNVGDCAIFLFSTILPPSLSFLVGGIGSALADLHLGYTHYAIFTLFVKGIEAIIVSTCIHRFPTKVKLLSFILGAVFMVMGYYFSDAILYGDYVVAFSGVGFNSMQGMISFTIASILFPIFKKITYRVKQY